MALPGILTALFESKEQLSDSDYSRAAKGITLDGICSMGMGALQGGVFLSAFAIKLGASNYEVGIIATFAFLTQLMQFPGLMLLRHFKKRRAIGSGEYQSSSGAANGGRGKEFNRETSC